MSLIARTEQTSSGEIFSVTPISIAEALRSTSKQFGEPGTYLAWSEGDAVHLSVGATLDVAVVEARKALAEHFEASAGIGNVYLVLDAVDSAALEAMEAKNLYDLAYALNDLVEAARDAERDFEQCIDLHSLPTFGGQEPTDTAGIWSWNASHILKRDDEFYVIARA